MKHINSLFFSDQFEYENNTLVVNIKNLSSKEELLEFYYKKLKFPDYFGFNWDALYDCLKDLDWIADYKINIYHSNIPDISKKDLEIYLDILYDIIRWYTIYKHHSINIYFMNKDKKLILEYWKKFNSK